MKRVAFSLLAICSVLMLFVSTAAVSLAAPPNPTGRADVNAPAVPGQYLIKFTPGTAADARRAVVDPHGGRFFDRVADLDIDAVEFPALAGNANPRAAEAIVNALKRNPNVEFVEPNYIYSAGYTPNDPSLGQQWAWNKIKAFDAWNTTQGSSGVVIAVVDTGIQRSHPDLNAKIVAGYDYVQGDTAPDDGNGHGTHVAGTAAAETNNSTGGAGTCPNCKLMPVRVLDNNGSGTLANVAKGINFAANNGAKVINLSLGGGGSSTLQSAVDNAWSKGAFLACAAGNSNTSSTSSAYPGAYGNCFAVASTTSSDTRSSFSNYGSWVEVAAPGSSIYSTWISSGYKTIDGTSMATPHVAGLASLLSSQGLTNSQIRQRICDTADEISGTGTYWTCGRINADRAVKGDATSPPPSGEAIVNGGFENGTSPWSQSSSGGYQLIDQTLPHTGAFSAYLGGYNNANDAIYQAITVPSDGTLTYWWYMSTEETSGPYDYLRVQLTNTSGGVLATLRTWSDRSGEGTWRQDSISLASYAGQTVRVLFNATNDSYAPTAFFVDDVSVK